MLRLAGVGADFVKPTCNAQRLHYAFSEGVLGGQLGQLAIEAEFK